MSNTWCIDTFNQINWIANRYGNQELSQQFINIFYITEIIEWQFFSYSLDYEPILVR